MSRRKFLDIFKQAKYYHDNHNIKAFTFQQTSSSSLTVCANFGDKVVPKKSINLSANKKKRGRKRGKGREERKEVGKVVRKEEKWKEGKQGREREKEKYMSEITHSWGECINY